VRFLRRNGTEEAGKADVSTVEVDSGDIAGRGYTPAKGKATPKRREAEAKRRGPVAPPPRNTREAIKRNRELRKANPVSKEDRRAAAKERRERMNAGEDKYLLPRDRGPVKAYVRDLVDSRRHVLGLFMPLALLVFVALLVPYQQVQQYATLLCTMMLLFMLVEGFLTGRKVTKAVRERFPDQVVKGRSIGWYAFIRASQLRKLRVPKPRVKVGSAV